MTITGATDLGNGVLAVTVDHDPEAVATDVPAGSLIITATGNHHRKLDDGSTTNVTAPVTLKDNLSATVDPTVSNDSTEDYEIGSNWVNTATDKVFMCTDASTGAAVWVDITASSAVDSVFGRTGAVVAAASDYDASQVDNDSGVVGATVKDALDQLDSDISGFTDAEDVFEWVLNGNVNAGTRFDGGRAARRAGTIVGVIITAGARGNNGTSLFDINIFVPAKPITTQRNGTGGTTIYTNQANRPDLDGNSPTSSENAVKQAPNLPDTTSFAAGDFFSMDVDSAVNQLQNVTVQLFVKYS